MNQEYIIQCTNCEKELMKATVIEHKRTPFKTLCLECFINERRREEEISGFLTERLQREEDALSLLSEFEKRLWCAAKDKSCTCIKCKIGRFLG